MRFNLADGFPLLTTKKLHLKSIVHELLWFLAGDTNIKYLKDNGVSIWDEWADEQRRSRPGLRHAVALVADAGWPPHRPDRQCDRQIRSNPDSRRLIVSAWNPAELDKMALPPCHACSSSTSPTASYPASSTSARADIFLGVPFNIASYALLTLMMAQVTGLKPGDFVHTFGDAHLYFNHLEQARLQLSRAPRPLPTMRINPDVKDIFAFHYEDFTLEGYDPHPHIKAEVAV